MCPQTLKDYEPTNIVRYKFILYELLTNINVQKWKRFQDKL